MELLKDFKLTDANLINVYFASAQEASQILTAEDEFLSSLSPFDMSARLRTSKPVSKKEFLDFIGGQSLDWTEEEKKHCICIFERIKALLREYNITLPEILYLIKTTGLDEGYSAYTRHKNVIVLPHSYLVKESEYIFKAFLHEIFHIFSKNNRQVMMNLYNAIGFCYSNEVEIPKALFEMKATDPDAVSNSFYFNAIISGLELQVVPLLIAFSKYNENEGGEFLDYLDLVFFAVKVEENSLRIVERSNGALKFSRDKIENYYDKIGSNTDFVIHPQEILASNFVTMVLDESSNLTAHPIAYMRQVLKK